MSDPTNPGDIPAPGGAVPPPPPPAPAPPPPTGPAFPPPPAGGGFPPPTQPVPVAGGPLGPPPGPETAKSKGPLFAVIAVVALILGAVGFFALSGDDDDKESISSDTTIEQTTTTADGPGGKEGSDEGDKGEEQTDGTASADAQTYGDDATLDALWDECEGGDYQACDDLYMESGFGTEYEEFGDTCGGRNEPQGYCVDVYDGTDDAPEDIDASGAQSYGDNEELDALWDACEEGDYGACDTLYMESDFGSEYEEFGDTCGGRNEPQGYCEDLYADG